MALVSPWAYTEADVNGKFFSVTVTFDNTLLTLLTITGHRDPGCLYRKFYIGLGANGWPDSVTSQFTLPDGDTVVAVALLNGFGFARITDVLAHQITAGP